MMNHLRVATFITLILLIITGLTNPTAAKGNKNDGEVIGIFSPGGRVLTITNQAVHGQLYGLVIDYCDGSHEEPFKGYLKIIFRGLLGPNGYEFYAEKEMRQVVFKLRPLIENGKRPDDFRLTMVQRKCGNPEPTPNLYCNNVNVARTIHRSWRGVPIEFKSTHHVVRAGLSFPGVDGLALTKKPEWNPKWYFPSIKYDPTNRTWRGTFISLWLPVGEYERVALVVQDDFGKQAKCPVGRISVQ
jgi:hypothetical protein